VDLKKFAIFGQLSGVIIFCTLC